MTYDQFLELARSLEGKELETISGKKFKVGIFRDCPFFIPSSTGLGRSDGRLAAERFLARYNETRNPHPSHYHDLTRNSSYLVALVQQAEDTYF